MTEYVRRILAGEMGFSTPIVVALVPRMETKTLEKPKVVEGSARKMDNGRPYNVIIWNDPVNTMDHVVRCLVMICGHSPQAAVNIMMAAHIEGKAICKTTAFEHAEAIREMLEGQKLTATIEET